MFTGYSDCPGSSSQTQSIRNFLEYQSLDSFRRGPNRGALSLNPCAHTISMETIGRFLNSEPDIHTFSNVRPATYRAYGVYLHCGPDRIERDVTELTAFLTTNTTLKTLEWSGLLSTVEEVKQIAESLLSNTTLSTLDLSDNLISDEGFSEVFKALASNTSLQTLYLGQKEPRGHTEYPVLNTLVSDESFLNTWKNDLIINSSLTSLNLSGLACGGVVAGDVILGNSSLTHLDLTDSGCTGTGVTGIGLGLRSNSTLTSLNLRLNAIDGEGIKMIVDSLIVNSTLTHLDLAYTCFRPIVAASIGEMLSLNGSLSALNLNGILEGFIGPDERDEGVQMIVSGLEANLTLKQLSMDSPFSQFSISKEHSERIEKCLTNNRTRAESLFHLLWNVHGNNLSST